ncbi:MAG: formyltransferase family protein [Bacteroidota bacterium]
MKIVLLTNNSSNQAALAVKIAERFQLAGIVIEERKASNKKRLIKEYISAALDRTLFSNLRSAWFDMLKYYQQKYAFPQVATIKVNSVNTDATIDFLNSIHPDLIMVSGTGMVKKKILEMNFSCGIINLHTGLSPYIKGGPNCTNWCIATNQFHLIGSTVMWIDAGIDSGDIIATETTQVTGEESLAELHIKVIEQAHQLYINCVSKLEKDCSKIKGVKQTAITEGRTFYTREWSIANKWKAVRNFRNFKSSVQSSSYKDLQNNLFLVRSD